MAVGSLGRGHRWLGCQQGWASAAPTADRPGTQTSSVHQPTCQSGSTPRSRGLSAQALNQGCRQPKWPSLHARPPPSLSATSSQCRWSPIHRCLRIPRSRDVGTGSWLQPEACLLAEPSLCPQFPLGIPPSSPCLTLLLGAPVHSFLHLVPRPEHLRLACVSVPL